MSKWYDRLYIEKPFPIVGILLWPVAWVVGTVAEYLHTAKAEWSGGEPTTPVAVLKPEVEPEVKPEEEFDWLNNVTDQEFWESLIDTTRGRADDE